MSFRSLLILAQEAFKRLGEDGVLCLGLPLAPLDPLVALPQLPQQDRFRWAWDGAPGLSIVASGIEQSLELRGPRRFALAQRFVDHSLSRITCAHHPLTAVERPRLALAFSFFGEADGDGVPGVTIILPRWQLARQGRHCWLLHQRTPGGAVTARSLAETLWEQAMALQCHPQPQPVLPAIVARGQQWEKPFRAGVSRALELIGNGELRKLVLAAQQQLLLASPLEPVELLRSLRRQQPGSCRFLWQVSGHHAEPAFVGASPERLLELRAGRLRCDGLAGTAAFADHGGQLLLGSSKDRHEHELVVEEILAALQRRGLQPQRRHRPRLARHGELVHLHTPIHAEAKGHRILDLAAALHPTPAVAGLPRRRALAWLRSLETFTRGQYGAPIGWVDQLGNADLRVAIRSGQIQGRHLTLTAGAGIVAGSSPDREQQEVQLKLSVLQRQFATEATGEVKAMPGQWTGNQAIPPSPAIVT